MHFKIKAGLIVLVCAILGCVTPSPLFAQQKGQWVPGQMGLNAGVTPDPGFTYVNMAINYSANTLNGPNGNALPGVTGTYSFWADENLFEYVPNHKFLGGYFAPFVLVNYVNGNLVAAIPALNLGATGGGSGLGDTYVEPLQLGWHFKRADVNTGYGFFAPTGSYTPGSSTNVGSGYWGNDWTMGSTVYLTKNRGTTFNVFTDWEFHHGQKEGILNTNVTPGQTFTTEWGVGQVLPLDKNFHKLLQVGAVGYDQWQVSDNVGSVQLPNGASPASLLPYYSGHGAGVQANFILPAQGLSAFFKYYDEFTAKASPQGRTFVFGFAWTLRIPKPTAPVPNMVSAECSVDQSSIMADSNQPVMASVKSSNTHGLPMNYSWTATGGKVEGTGPQARWDSTGVAAGTYTITARVDDGHGASSSCSSDVTVNPKPNPPPTMSCSVDRSSVLAGERATVTASVNDQTNTPLTYTWQSNGGQIVGTGSSVQLDTTGLAAGDYVVTGRVANGNGGAADCTATVTVQAPPAAPEASKIGTCNFKSGSAKVDNVCKRTLDDVAVRLQNDPKATVVLVGYSDPKERKADTVAKDRGDNASGYLSKTKGIADSRVTSRTAAGTEGAGNDNYRVDIMFVPDGATY